MSRKFLYQEVFDYIKNNECQLLSKEYYGQEKKLEILFSCGHKEKRSFNKFKQGKNICSRCAGVKKYSYVEVFDTIKENGYFLMSPEYKDCKSNLEICDSDGYKYQTCFDKILNNVIARGCPLAKFGKNNPHTIENISLFLRINNSNLILDESQIWNGNNKKMSFTDSEGYKYSSGFDVIQVCVRKNLLPAKFDISNIYTLHNIKNWIKINKRPYELIDGQKYLGKEYKLKFRCLKCPSEEKPFDSVWSSLQSKDTGCPYCNSTYIGNCNSLEYKYPEIAKEWDYEKNHQKIPSQVSGHTGKKFYWKCPDCGNSFLSSVCKRTSNEPRGCPFCVESNLEKKVRKFLEKNNVSFVPQKRFDDCKDILMLPFDFFIDGHNAVCETHGKQHFEPLEFFGGKEQFMIRKKHDEIKKNYCITNNINFIEIPYWEYDNIESILTKELNLASS